MSVRLLVLGLLLKRPLHGYEIKHIVETEMGDWANIAIGSIYFALAKLSSDALIEERETSQAGGRPARTVYEITARGRAEFESLLRETWEQMERQSFALDMGIAFMDMVPKAELRGSLAKRIGILEGILAGLDEHQEMTARNPEVPEQARFIFSHHRLHCRAELEWTKEMLEGLS